MLTIIRDYFAANKVRYKKAFCILFGLFLVVEIAVIIQTHPNSGVQPLLILVVASGFCLAIVLGGVVLLIGATDAYFRAIRLARASGVPVAEYAKSTEYQQQGKNTLRRNDEPPKWF